SNSVSERRAIRTFSSSANCARIPPAERLVEPEASVSRSTRTTSSTPSFRRCQPTLAPIAPPPMTTTSAESTHRALHRRAVSAHAVDEQSVEAVGQFVGGAASLKPRVGPVCSREEEQRRDRLVEVGAKLTELAPLAEELADPLLVPPPLGEKRVSPLAGEVPPLADEDRRHVELLRDQLQVRAQRQPDPLRDWKLLGDRVKRRVEGGGPGASDLPEQVLLRIDVRIERALLHAQRRREVADRRAVVALLREEPRGLARQLGAP